MERKVKKIGNNLGVTLPLEVLKHLGIKNGDEICFDLAEGYVAIKKKTKLKSPNDIDEEFLDQMNDMVTEYNKTFKGLADR